MERRAFDGLARTVGQASPRRGAFSLLASIALAGVLTRLGLEESAARKHGRNRGHHPGKHKRNRKGKRKHGQGPGQSKACVSTGQICSVFGNPCCDGGSCRITGGLVVTTCQTLCASKDECVQTFGTDFYCETDPLAIALACPGLSGCCLTHSCTSDTQCPGGGSCCQASFLYTDGRACCAQDETCGPSGGCKKR
jgi:hypothetical protein